MIDRARRFAGEEGAPVLTRAEYLLILSLCLFYKARWHLIANIRILLTSDQIFLPNEPVARGSNP